MRVLHTEVVLRQLRKLGGWGGGCWQLRVLAGYEGQHRSADIPDIQRYKDDASIDPKRCVAS